MDTHVKYILLLLVVTVVCIGVSADVKYDKDYSSDTGLPGHYVSDLSIIQPEITKLQQQIQTLTSRTNVESLPDYDANSGVSYIYSNGKLSTTTGAPTITNINNLFKYQSKFTHGTNQFWVSTIYGEGTKNILYTLPGDDSHITLIPVSGGYNIQFTKNNSTIKVYLLYGTNLTTTVTSPNSKEYVFQFNPNGKLQYQNLDITVSVPSSPTDLTLPVVKNNSSTGSLHPVLYNSTATSIIQLNIQKQNTSNVSINNLVYFGLTSGNLLPPPNTPYTFLGTPNTDKTISASIPLPQVILGNTLGTIANLGLFAKTLTATSSPTGANITGAAGYIYTGLKSVDATSATNYRIHYVTTHFGDNRTLQLPSLWHSSEFALSAQPRYSIYVVLADTDTDDISDLIFEDINETKGTQTVVLFGSPYSGFSSSSAYQSLADRASTSASSSEITNMGSQRYYQQFGPYNLNSLLFFKFNENGIPHAFPATVSFANSEGWSIISAEPTGFGATSYIPVNYGTKQSYNLSEKDYQNFYNFDAQTFTHRVYTGNATTWEDY